MLKKFIVITTINKETKGIKKFSEKFHDWQIILVGDKKSKNIKNKENIIFLSVDDQKKLGFKTVKFCPHNHYARKNIGYLYAIKSGADIIYETDDDNIPYNNWGFPDFSYTKYITTKNKFLNVYKHFTKEKIWPRGYPLDEINTKNKTKKTSSNIKVGVWQGLANKEPDVDAVYRLTFNKKIIFKKNSPIVLGKNIYCPFNSQNTLWNKDNFALMYLPSTVNFRFTDILRSYIAQKLMWENNQLLGFTKATVYQERNEHNLIKDFKDEVECYLNTKPIVNILDKLDLDSNYLNGLKKIYKTLESLRLVTKTELKILEAWIQDINNLEQKHDKK